MSPSDFIADKILATLAALPPAALDGFAPTFSKPDSLPDTLAESDKIECFVIPFGESDEPLGRKKTAAIERPEINLLLHGPISPAQTAAELRGLGYRIRRALRGAVYVDDNGSNWHYQRAETPSLYDNAALRSSDYFAALYRVYFSGVTDD